MSIIECFRLMGYPDNFKLEKSNSCNYEHIGNSVSPIIIEKILQEFYNQSLFNF